jgi:hypothetical protein
VGLPDLEIPLPLRLYGGADAYHVRAGGFIDIDAVPIGNKGIFASGTGQYRITLEGQGRTYILGAGRVDPLQPGQVVVLRRQQATVPSYASPGQYALAISVELTDSAPECSLTNNRQLIMVDIAP